MDITRSEQRILHLLAQGGWIEHIKNHKTKIADVKCFSRDGWLYPGLDLEVFRRLKRLKAISSSRGQPYRITGRGLVLVRSQVDNR
ncbi:YjhX family toxin [Rhizobium sp. LjRoot254]|uniref:YjhX family toxin n=1 Tax=Rhizobium sp. LjRoot254 TaxID=3342297 RepID=UPI003ECF384F